MRLPFRPLGTIVLYGELLQAPIAYLSCPEWRIGTRSEARLSLLRTLFEKVGACEVVRSKGPAGGYTWVS